LRAGPDGRWAPGRRCVRDALHGDSRRGRRGSRFFCFFAEVYEAAAWPRDGMLGRAGGTPFEARLRQDLEGYRLLDEDGESEIAFGDRTGEIERGGVVRNSRACRRAVRERRSASSCADGPPTGRRSRRLVFGVPAAGVNGRPSSRRRRRTAMASSSCATGVDAFVRLQQKREPRGLRAHLRAERPARGGQALLADRNAAELDLSVMTS